MKLIDDDKPSHYQGVAHRLTKMLTVTGLISDTNVGGVAQILAETFAREMATFYAILEKAHEAGYLETAKGQALDNVVALLGVRRTKPGLLHGKVKFSRRTPAPQDIVIPAGAKVTGPPMEDGNTVPLMETVTQARIQNGQRSVIVDIREVIDSKASKIIRLPPDTLSIMPNPLLGVDQVSNPEPVLQGGQEESDEQLRARAGAVLGESQKGTHKAIKVAVRNQGIEAVEVKEAPDDKIGLVQVRIGDPDLEKNPDRKKEVFKAIQDVKAAGICIKLETVKTVYCHIIATVTPQDAHLEPDVFGRLAQELKENVTGFINGLSPGVSITREKLKAVFLGNQEVQEVVVKMRMFSMAPSGSGEEICGFDDEDKDKDKRWKKEEDKWTIEEMEKALIDPEQWPVEIVPKKRMNALLNLSVWETEAVTDKSKLERSLSQAIEDYINDNRMNEKDGTPTLFQLNLDKLIHELRQAEPASEQREVRLAWLVHQDNGAVEYISPEHPAEIKRGEQFGSPRIYIKEKKGES